MLPNDLSSTGEAEAVTAMLEQMPNDHRRIPVPRRLIRSSLPCATNHCVSPLQRSSASAEARFTTRKSSTNEAARDRTFAAAIASLMQIENRR
jgi:hypothetical protein